MQKTTANWIKILSRYNTCWLHNHRSHDNEEIIM